MRPLRPVLLAGLLPLLLLAGCGSYEYQITAPGGADAAAGDIVLRDTRFAASGSSEGDEAYAAGSDAALAFTAVNEGDATDRLLGVSSPVAGGTDIGGDVQVPGGLTLVSGPVPATAVGTVRTSVTLTDLREPLRAGLTYPVTFRFERGGSQTLQVPIENPDALPSVADRSN